MKRASCHLLFGTLVFWSVLSPVVLSAEQGQYRSKVMITPEGEWSRGAELSIEELERQLGSIEDAYAQSSAGRHLARHYVERKEYDKAIAFYRDALSAQGLSAVANREMLREVAQVYLLKKDYGAAAQALQQALDLDLVPEIADYLLLARAQHHLGRYVEVVKTLDRMQQSGQTLDAARMRQALALYYHAGAYSQCEVLLTRLLEIEPNDAQHWHLLASVYLQQNKKKQALDQLVLAREKNVPFTERDILLLASLQAANTDPFGGAQTLETALTQQQVPGTGENYRRLFEFWLQAREPERARGALEQAARLSGNADLYLHLAQLQMDDQQYEQMQQTLLAACARELPENLVGRANLLLGVSQLKLNNAEAARRSFINATLVGGVNAQAGEWLRFMQAAPATKAELRRIVSICAGPEDKKLSASEMQVAARDATVAEQPPEAGQTDVAPADDTANVAIETRTVPAMRLFYMDYAQPLTQLMDALRGTVISMNVALVKSGGTADGPLQIIISGDPAGSTGAPAVQLGMPLRGAATGSGRFKIRNTEPFKCVYRRLAGSGGDLTVNLARLAEHAKAAGYELSGEMRIVIPVGDSSQGSTFELQLGVH